MRSSLLALAPLLLCFHCSGDEADRPRAADRGVPEEELPLGDAGVIDTDASVEPDAGDPSAFPAPLDQLDLGTVDGDAVIEFDLPENVAGFQIVAKRDPSQDEFTVQSLTGPDGSSVVTAKKFAGTQKDQTPALSLTTLATTVPQHDTEIGLKPQAGTWKLRLAGAGGDVSVRILLRRTSDGAPKPGLLDLKVYIPQGLVLDEETITVANAETIAAVQDRIAGFDSSIERLYGVRLGRVRYAPMPAKFRALEETFFEAGLETEGDGRVLHLVLSEETQSFWGIAGGIPGAVGTSKSENSVFALSSLWRTFSGELGGDYGPLAAVEGDVLAHEVGHFLGLFHSTEGDGSDADPLEDTPQCPAATIGSSLESCPDYSNVMFFSSQDPNMIASPLQKRVVQGSALLRGFTTSGALQTRRPVARQLVKPGFLFHAPTSELTQAQRLAMSGACGSGSHGRISTPAPVRAELERIAADTTLAPAFRHGAARALGH